MKKFHIYKNSFDKLEAVKVGWSWPGFFFVWMWCILKGLVGIGISIFVVLIFLALSPVNDYLPPVVALLTSLFIGYSGNELWEKKLRKNGYELAGSVEASNPEGALSKFVKEQTAERTKSENIK